MIKATVTEIYDMNTHIGALGLIGIHTPRTDLLFKHLSGLFMQFKKWKYNGARFSLIPAAQLPADIAGVSLEGGDQSVDPRDVFNPILHKGFTGESLGAFLDKYLDPGSMRGPSLDYTIGESGGIIPDSVNQETAYYQMLTQGGFKKMAPMGAIRNQKIYPMVYDLASTRQLTACWNGITRNDVITRPMEQLEDIALADDSDSNIIPSMRPDGDLYVSKMGRPVDVGVVRYGNQAQYIDSTSYGLDPNFITPRKMKLGWMDTLQRVLSPKLIPGGASTNVNSDAYTFAQLPKLYEYLIVTPPSYYSRLYYRLVLQHEVWFSGLRSATGASNAIDSNDVEYNNYMDALPGESSTMSTSSIDVLGGDVTPVTDGMSGSIL